MATGTSGDERDDEITEPIGDDVDTELDAADAADPEHDAVEPEMVDDEAELAAAEAEVDDEAAAEVDLDADSGAVAPVAAGARPKSAKAGAAVDKAPEKKSPAKKAAAKKPATREEPKGIAKFLREVGAELRKVVTPTRKELWRYVGVVLGFLIIMMAIVMALDFVFGFLSSWVFGEGTDLFPQPAAPVEPAPPATP